MSFEGKVAIITGGARGIGEACANLLMARGASVVVADIQPDRAAATAQRLQAAFPGRRALARQVDVRKQADCFAMADFAVQELGRVDVLVNSAGIIGPAPSLEVTEEAWNNLISINLSGTFFCCQAVARYMQDHGGAIVNLSSIAAQAAWPRRVSYAAAKAGITAVTSSLAVEWGPFQIRVNAVAPTWVATELVVDAFKSGVVDRSRLDSATPLGRIAVVEDIARAVGFLASDEASMITGQVLYVDGGFLAGAPFAATR
ncbi:MAG: SDR family NAD(P)-dependent oxidoreductase [Anaerolineae bacterium]